jgi:hypothetical protein
MNTEALGIWVAVVFHDTPETIEDYYLSYSEHELENDEEVFYYLTEDERKELDTAISNNEKRYEIDGNEWYVDLSCDYTYDYA